jgi:hypothetical protein
MNDFLERLSAERCTDLEFRNTINLDSALFNNGNDSLYTKGLYISRFCRIPNWIHLDEIDCYKVNEWFVQNYQDRITDCNFIKRNKMRPGVIGGHSGKGGGVHFDDVYYYLFEDMLVYLNHNQSEAKILYRKTDSALVDKLVDEIRKFKKRKQYTRKKPEIELLTQSSSGLSTISMKISKPKFSIEDNYNDDFSPVHQTILDRLRKKNDKGLVLLHGKPETGKTSYIRYLITKTKKRVIFLPPNMAASITDPGLMNVLIENPNSVFVIEDAENIIIDRNRSGSSSVSALLNLADGLLSDCLNIQIVCSFNTDLSRVDSALTRKGRLIAKYEFAELDVAKAQVLSNKLGFSSVIESPMTLAAVYNQNEMEFGATTLRSRVGFKIAV